MVILIQLVSVGFSLLSKEMVKWKESYFAWSEAHRISLQLNKDIQVCTKINANSENTWMLSKGNGRIVEYSTNDTILYRNKHQMNFRIDQIKNFKIDLYHVVNDSISLFTVSQTDSIPNLTLAPIFIDYGFNFYHRGKADSMENSLMMRNITNLRPKVEKKDE